MSVTQALLDLLSEDPGLEALKQQIIATEEADRRHELLRLAALRGEVDLAENLSFEYERLRNEYRERFGPVSPGSSDEQGPGDGGPVEVDQVEAS